MPNYPSSADTFPGTTAQGGSLLTSPDHAADHRLIGSSLNIIENTVLGTTAGTNVLKNFNSGDFAARINSSNILQQPLTGTLGMTTGTIAGGTITGQITNSGTLAQGYYGTPNISHGTIGSAILQTPSVDVIAAVNSGTAILMGNAIAPSGAGTLTDSAGGTLTANAQTSQIYYSVQGTSAGNRTIATPTNPTPYQLLTYAFKASGSANGTLVWGTAFRFNTGGTPAMGTGNTWNYYGFRFNGIDSIWDFLGASQF